MRYFETFNFDIIILLILIASIITGIYFGFYRQARKTFTILVPFIVLYFVFEKIILLLETLSFYSFIQDKVFKNVTKFIGLSQYLNTTTILVIGIIAYVLIALFVSFIFSLFKVSAIKQITKKPNTFSKVNACILAIINGYVLIIILMYSMKPLTNLNYNLFVTDLFTKTSNEVITISKLNEYQYLNVEKHQNYENAFAHLSGKKVYSIYLELNTFYESLDEINNQIKNEYYPSMTDESKTLIDDNLVGEDYIGCLLKTVNNRVVFLSILAHEKNSVNYTILREKYNYLLNHRGYIFINENLLSNDFSTYSVFELNEIFQNNKDEILNHFSDLRIRNDFIKKLEALNFFTSHYDEYKNLVDDNINDLDAYLIAYENIFHDYDELAIFANIFVENYPDLQPNTIEFYIFTGLNDFLNNQETIKLMNNNMSISTALTIINNNKLVNGDLSKFHPLLKAYLKDSILYPTKGYDLYHEYFFYKYLAYNINLNDGLDIDDFNIILTNLDNSVNQNIISTQEAQVYLEALFSNSHSVIFDLRCRKKVADTLFQEIKNLNNQYITDHLKEIINNI